MLTWYVVRYETLRPVRRILRGLVWLVSRVPGTTNGEVAEMGLTPCARCMGRAVAEDVKGVAA